VSYLGGGNGPDLEVVRAHEKVGDTSTHHADNPLVEVLGLVVGNASLKGSVDHAVNALDLLGLGKHGDVVLEGVRDPFFLATDVGDTLVCEPVVILGESLVDAVVEVLVVGKDNVATDIVQLFPGEKKGSDWGVPRGSWSTRKIQVTYEAFRGHISGGKTTRGLVGVDNQPRGVVLYN
jgi:hypothetical protein